ncbi:MAG: helix-turn-helix domain-containing protein [Oscillospiraceae bacterium]|jgi:transcriptional regulator with XRE-family HTH domain|nr:helix-turn-helix domain-containing protein [Oscillospiraceae bacterium]
MDTNNIGKNIAKFRRERGLTQESVAAAVGVSGQAVSKWEVGGSPDIELLPAISDCLGVSIDALFGRDALSHTDIVTEVWRAVAEAGTLSTSGFQLSCELAWAANRGMFGISSSPKSEYFKIEDIMHDADDIKPTNPIHSVYQNDGELCRIRIDKERRYYLLMPAPPEGWSFDGETDELLRLFALFADADFFKAAIFLHKREELKFTASYLGKTLGLDDEKTAAVIAGLKSIKLVNEDVMEYDETRATYYISQQNSAIVPFLTLAEDMLKPASVFYGGMLGPQKWLR